MAVAHDNATESHTGTTGATGDFSWTHTPSGTPKGILVFVINRSGTNQPGDSAVTYGGVAVPVVAGGVADDATGTNEGGCTKAYFLGDAAAIAGRASDTVAVTEGSSTFSACYAVAITVTASGDTEITDVDKDEDNAALAVKALDDGSPGTNSVRYAAGAWGGSSVPSAGTGSTALVGIDFGVFASAAVRETTAGQGSRNVGFNTGATSDDRAFVYVAVSEVVPTSTAVADISLATHGTPVAYTDHTIKVRARTTSGSTGTIRAALYEGSTNRSGDLETSALTTSFADYTLPIAEVDAEDITDYSNLSIRLWGYDAAGNALVFEVAELYVELPEAAPGVAPPPLFRPAIRHLIGR